MKLLSRQASFGMRLLSHLRGGVVKGRCSGESPCRLESLEPRVLMAANPIINEFMADNDSTLADGNGEFSDWIEIYNAGDEAIDLAGWSLTDDENELGKWTFPSVVIEADAYLVVFASGDGVADLGGNLHTNFSLNANGEYLALVEPDGTTIATEFSPEFPDQHGDISFGNGVLENGATLIDRNSDATYLIPTDGALGTTWTGVGFDDSGWNDGSGAIGFDQDSGIQPVGENGILAHFPFDEVAGFGDPVDNTVSTIEGSLINGAQVVQGVTPAPFGNAIEFEPVGSGGGVNLGADPSVKPTDDFTMTFWFNADVLDAFDRLVESMDGTIATSRGLRMDLGGAGNRFRTLLRDGTGSQNNLEHSTVLSTNTWYFTAVRFEADGNVDITLIPENTVVDETAVGAATESQASVISEVVYEVGRATVLGVESSAGTATNAFNGRMDDLAFFSSVLSDEAVAEIYNNGANPDGGDGVILREGTFGYDAALSFDAGGTWQAAEDNDAANNRTWALSAGNTREAVDSELGGITTAYVFDGTQLGTTGTFNVIGAGLDHTFEVWVKLDDLDTGGVNEVIYETGGSGNGYSIVQRDDQLVFRHSFSGNNGNPALRVFAETAITLVGDDLDDFIQVTGVFDRAQQKMLLYGESLDNEYSSEVAWTLNNFAGGNGASLGFNSGDQNVGGYAPGQDVGGEFANFNGQIARLSVFGDLAMSAAEVRGRFDAVAAMDEGPGDEGTPFPTLGWNAADTLLSDNNGNIEWLPRFGSGFDWNVQESTAPDQVTTPDTLYSGITHAYRYDGDEFVAFSNTDDNNNSFNQLGATNSVTFEMWIRPDGLTNGKQVLWEAGGVNGASITLNNDVLRFATSQSPDEFALSYTLVEADLDDFIHVAGVVDTLNDVRVMYVNGVQVGELMNATGDTWTGTNGSGLGTRVEAATGGYSDAGTAGTGPEDEGGTPGVFESFVGDIAIFNFYDSVLDGDDIAETFNRVSVVDYTNLIETNVVNSMAETSSSIYQRIPFELGVGATFDTLSLRMKYDDGFVAYLNGTKVAEANAPVSPVFDSVATGEHADEDALVYEEFDLTGFVNLLQAGENVLAIHGLNSAVADSDFLIHPELVGTETPIEGAFYLFNPTPGGANDNDGTLGFVGDTTFSVDRGFYETAFDVEITSSTEDAIIVYTTDGSAPTLENGEVYDGPVTISTTTILKAAGFKPNFQPTNVDSQTYLFLADVINQPANPEGLPTTWAGVQADYEMDPDVVGENNLFNDLYRNTIIDDLKSLPTMSISLDMADMFGPQGIYTNPQSSGRAWERPASVEFFTADGSEEFQINSGIRVQGGSSRSVNYPKHSMRLEFRDDYGPSRLEYDLFGNQPYGEGALESFDEIVLRARFNQSWTHWHPEQAFRAQYVRDQWARDLQFAMGHNSTNGRYTHLYINGLYWGIYNIGERPAAPFQEDHTGIDEYLWDVINSNEAVDGNDDAWDALIAQANAGLTSQNAYEAIQEVLDLENFTDYMIMNFYFGNSDWDGHNWISARPKVEGGKWQFYAWDSEFAIALPPNNTGDLNQVLNQDRTGLNSNNNPSRIYNQLRQNSEYRVYFSDRVQKLFFNDGVFTPENAMSVWEARAAQIDRALVAESARWGDYRRDVNPQGDDTPADFALFTRDEHYLTHRTWILNTYFPQRTDIVLGQFENRGLYPDTGPANVAVNGVLQHGGRIEVGDLISFETDAPVGSVIYYTTDGSDPRLTGGGVSGTAVVYGADFTLAESGTLKVRVLNGGEWSALVEADFTVDVPLRVSEISYNPDGDDAVAFIELINTGVVPIDLEGVSFVFDEVSGEGIAFTFMSGDRVTSVGPGEHVVIPKDPIAFEAAYPEVPVSLIADRGFEGSLSNGGEKLTLLDAAGGTIHAFAYDDDWDKRTDGDGPSLSIIDANGDIETWGDAASWRVSGMDGGTPGRVDPVDGAIEGDATYDGIVNLEDLAKLATNFGRSAVSDPTQDVRWLHGDFTGDGIVDLADLAKLATNFGTNGSNGFPVGGGAVSEEGVLALLSKSGQSGEALLVNTEAKLGGGQEVNWDHIGNLLDEEGDASLI